MNRRDFMTVFGCVCGVSILTTRPVEATPLKAVKVDPATPLVRDEAKEREALALIREMLLDKTNRIAETPKTWDGYQTFRSAYWYTLQETPQEIDSILNYTFESHIDNMAKAILYNIPYHGHDFYQIFAGFVYKHGRYPTKHDRLNFYFRGSYFIHLMKNIQLPGELQKNQFVSDFRWEKV